MCCTGKVWCRISLDEWPREHKNCCVRTFQTQHFSVVLLTLRHHSRLSAGSVLALLSRQWISFMQTLEPAALLGLVSPKSSSPKNRNLRHMISLNFDLKIFSYRSSIQANNKPYQPKNVRESKLLMKIPFWHTLKFSEFLHMTSLWNKLRKIVSPIIQILLSLTLIGKHFIHIDL